MVIGGGVLKTGPLYEAVLRCSFLPSPWFLSFINSAVFQDISPISWSKSTGGDQGFF